MRSGSLPFGLEAALHQLIAWLERLTAARFSVGVTGIVFDEAGRVMLLKHTFRRRYPWGLVSGWIKRGETPAAALHREVAEETSLSIHIERLYRVRTDRLHRAVEVVYLCHLRGGTFRPCHEVTAIRWCAPDALPEGVHPHHAPLIRAAAALRGAAPRR